jgi:hypothetical protein
VPDSVHYEWQGADLCRSAPFWRRAALTRDRRLADVIPITGENAIEKYLDRVFLALKSTLGI